MNITTMKSERKRIFVSGSSAVESDDEGSGAMSPLCTSSADGYSSPPLSYTMEFGTVLNEVCDQSFSDWPSSETETPDSSLCPFDLYASSVQKLPLSKTQDIRGQHKGKIVPASNMELVEESPMKGPIKMSILTPFKCLASKGRQNEMPKQKSQKLVFEESCDIVSATAPVKALQTPNPDYEANTELTHFDTFTDGNNLRPIPSSLFFHSSHARAALYPEPSSAARNTVCSVTGTKKHKRLANVESYSQICSLSKSKTHMAKRRKIEEIDVDVCHRIKKCKKKRTYKHPVDTAQHKNMPEDRLQSYVDKVAHSVTGTKNSIYNEKDVHFTPRHGVQPCVTGRRMKRSSSPLTSNTVEPTCRASPLPDPPRKFFKFPSVRKSKTSETVTVSKNIKLVSFCSIKYIDQLNLSSNYETCLIVICNMDCKLSSFFPRIITRLLECYQLLRVIVNEVVTMFYFFMFFSSNICFKLLL